MAPRLLEREAELAALDSAVAGAAAGASSVVLLFGEAGIGETSVVRAFQRAASGRARVLAGACDDLLTPRTLRDAARAASTGPLATALAGGDRDAVLSAVVDELSDPRGPTVLVVEDVHWADEATLDVLRYVGRRIGDLPAMLLLTYRDDEVVRDHPLQRVLGGLSGETVHVCRWRHGRGVTRPSGGAAGDRGRSAEPGRPLYEQALRATSCWRRRTVRSSPGAYAWSLFHSDRRREALSAAAQSVRLREDLGDDAVLGKALACLSVQQWSGLQAAAALASSERAAPRPSTCAATRASPCIASRRIGGWWTRHSGGERSTVRSSNSPTTTTVRRP